MTEVFGHARDQGVLEYPTRRVVRFSQQKGCAVARSWAALAAGVRTRIGISVKVDVRGLHAVGHEHFVVHDEHAGTLHLARLPAVAAMSLSPNPPKGWRYSSGMAMSGKGGRWFGQDFG